MSQVNDGGSVLFLILEHGVDFMDGLDDFEDITAYAATNQWPVRRQSSDFPSSLNIRGS